MEASGDVDVLLLDKTGTITLGNRQAAEFLPAPGIESSGWCRPPTWRALADETPEGRSIVALARRFGIAEQPDIHSWAFVPFSAMTRMSGVEPHGVSIRKGAARRRRCSEDQSRGSPPSVREQVERIARSGGTPLLVAENHRRSARSTSRTSSSRASRSASRISAGSACAP